MQPIARYGFVGQKQVWQLLFMCVLTLSLFFFREAQGQQRGNFTKASLDGQFALVGTGGDHTAASVGIETYDGRGNVTRSLVLNELDADHKRKVVTINGQGTYHVQPNGMGIATIVNTLPNGSTFTSHLDFVITQATTTTTNTSDVKRATALFAILREPGIAAPLVTFTLTRLPD